MSSRLRHITTILLLLLTVCGGKAWGDTWDGTTKSTTVSGSGTEEDPYLIQSAADLAYFGSKYPNNTAWWKLTTDVDLNNQTWTYGQKKNAFKGHFDGDGHTVSNISIPVTSTGNYGFFSIVQGADANNRAEIKNLTLSNVIITSTTDLSSGTNIGGLAGGLKWAVVTNVHIQGGTISTSGIVTSDVQIGNMCGLTYAVNATTPNVDFIDCYSEDATLEINGNVTNGNVYASNFLGFSYQNTDFSNCHVINSTVTATTGGTIAQDKSFCVGGLIGAIKNFDGTGKTGDIENSSVTGQTINLPSYGPADASNFFKNNFAIGGVIGRIWTPYELPQNVYFSGTVNAPKAAVGPVVGIMMNNRNNDAFVYNDYSGENIANISTDDRNAAFGTWSYGNYRLGISSDLLSSGKQLNITSSDVDANGYVTIGDISGWTGNSISGTAKSSKTIIWYNKNGNSVSNSNNQGINPKWTQNDTSYPSYYMYYLQGVNRGSYSPASYAYTLQLYDWPQTAYIQVDGDANAGASYNTDGGTVTTNPNRVTATNVTASVYNGFTSTVSVDNPAMTITAYYTKQYTLQFIDAPSSGVSVTIDHDYNNGLFTSGTYTADGTVEVTPSFSASDITVSPVDGYNITAAVNDAASTITVTYALKTYSVTTTQPMGGSIKLWDGGMKTSLNKTAGTAIYMLATPADGYVLSAWNVTDADGNAVAVSNNTFTMPAKAVTVTATFEAVPSLVAGKYVVIQSTSATGKYLKLPAAGNSVTAVDGQYDTESVMQLVRYKDFWNVEGGFWLNGVAQSGSWVGYPQNGSNSINAVATQYARAKDDSGNKANNGYGWAGNYSISKCGTDANGAIYKLTDINYNCLNNNKNYLNRTIALNSSNINGSDGSLDASKWYIHVVTPYTVSITPVEANGSIAYSGNNLYGMPANNITAGTCYFEGDAADAFTGNAVDGLVAGTVSVDNINHTITLKYTPKCVKPTITRNGNEFTFDCSFPTTGVTIKYTTDGSDPVNGTVYTGSAVHVNDGTTLKVIAMATDYVNSEVVVFFVSQQASGSGTESDPYLIETVFQMNDIKDNPGSYYLLNADIDVSGFEGVTNDFSGTFDGNFHTITGLGHAIFNKVAGGIVRNVTVDNVNITSGVNVGAIANEASGNARIYNCQVLASDIRATIADPANEDKDFSSSSCVTGTGAVGGIVGKISDNVRVINCVSYADVNGGTYGAGIVGQYSGSWITNTGTTVNGNGIIVMNCLMLGNVISGTTQKSPIVGGSAVTSTISTWDYFRYASMTDVQSMKSNQNGALTIDEDKWLTRFEFFRSCLNNHRDIAAVYCLDDANKKSEIAKWTINESISPWPVLKAHDENTRKTLDRTISVTTEDNAGRQLGALAVTAIINGSSRTIDLPITDMDHAHYDYTWGKVILPFANEFTGWTPQTTATTDYDRIIIGWEITSLTGGTTGTLTDYNFADRDCTAKDVYHATNNPFIYAQGGMFIVPNGVTAITITAHWANAFYLADEYYDMDISTMPFSDTYTPSSYINCGGLQRTTYNGKTIYHSLREAQAKMSTDYLCDKQAIVLVGNYHFRDSQKESGRKPDVSKGFTIMSIDEDADQEPDYGVFNALARDQIYHIEFPAARWDFIPTYATGIFQKSAKRAMLFSVPKMRGWWEFTETCLARTYELEAWDNVHTNSDNGKGNNAFIINGGYHTQFIRGRGTANKLSYVKVGGNAFVKEFFQGNHSSDAYQWKLIPTIVTGGEITYCYMTGQSTKNTNGNNVITTNGINNVRFYCSGGKIGKFLGCYMEWPVNNVTANIDHAIFDKFYGGGTNETAAVTGDITINIKNSYVEHFCGGPEFGNMKDGKVVTVNADNSTFGTYYGAGYGGTAMTRIKSTANNGEQGDNQNAAQNIDDYNSYHLQSKTGGIGVYYEIEEFMNARGQYYFRFYDYTADLNLATTGNVTSTLNNCIILNNFYGGGCQGKVDGTITSTLTDCTVQGSVFGGGYKAAATEVDVYSRLTTWPKFDDTFGAFDAVQYPTPVKYKWEYVETMPGTPYGTNSNGENVLYTTTNTSQMGVVTGAIGLTINGGSVAGNVYGGGNESPSGNNTSVTISGTAQIVNSVFGGGNLANVQGSASVTIDGGTIADAVYGGGALANTGDTQLNLNGGTVNDVYGGGLGRLSSGTEGQPDYISPISATVGSTTVNIGTGTFDGDGNLTSASGDCTINGKVFGCNNLNGTPLGNATVNVYKTHSNTPADPLKPYNSKIAAVYGGGNLAAYLPTDMSASSTATTRVEVFTCWNVIDYVYGGGNAASTPATSVTVHGGKMINVFGGGNGKTEEGAATPNPGADVGYRDFTWDNDHAYGKGTTDVHVWGGEITSVFGGSNTKGNIRISSNVDLDDRGACEFNIGDVYGAGNEAEMYGDGIVTIGCIPGMTEIYGGSKSADIIGDVVLTITNGEYDKVFGGNNLGGCLKGSITVNIEETGCNPIKINELYGGGNKAAYSIYGYNDDGTPKTSGEVLYSGPTLNIRSFTSIDKVYGGGYGAEAVVYGNPTVNIQEVKGVWAGQTYNGETIPDTIGTIGTVFGGGNSAPVVGNTSVNIATQSTTTFVSDDGTAGWSATKTVEGANITGNVYGGGNAADVSGSTSIVVGM